MYIVCTWYVEAVFLEVIPPQSYTNDRIQRDPEKPKIQTKGK